MNNSHVLYDSDPHFKIDPISRKITNESSTKTTIIQNDHNSERFTFEMPRYVEGHDMSLCNVVEVHYLNIEANTKSTTGGVYSIDDLKVKTDDENTVVCSWLVSMNATRFVGQLQFLIRFACANKESGQIDYVWNTGVYSGISISSGIYNGDTDSDNPVPAFNFVTTITGEVLKFFVGTKAQYDKLSFDDRQNLFAIITDDKAKDEILKDIKDLQTAVSALEKNPTVTPDHVHKFPLVASATVKNGEATITESLTSGSYLFVYSTNDYTHYSGVGYIEQSSFDKEVIQQYIALGAFCLYLRGTVNEETEKTSYNVNLRYISYFPDKLGEAEANYSGGGTLSIYKIGVI